MKMLFESVSHAEKLALRQQLAILNREIQRPKMHRGIDSSG
jgi:hypothetical protein